MIHAQNVKNVKNIRAGNVKIHWEKVWEDYDKWFEAYRKEARLVAGFESREKLQEAIEEQLRGEIS